MQTELERLFEILNKYSLKYNHSFGLISDVDKCISKHSKSLGTEIHNSIRDILEKKNKTSYRVNFDIRVQEIAKKVDGVHLNLEKYKNDSYDKKFDLNNYLNNYLNKNVYSNRIINEFEKAACQDYIRKIHLNIDFDKLIPNTNLYTHININHRLSQKSCNSAKIDCIVDDKIIDFKTSLKLDKVPLEHISQLVYYYLFLRHFDYCNSNNKSLKNELFNINKICLYYLNFNLFIEFDVSDIFDNYFEIDNLFYNEIFYGNNCLRLIVDNAISNKSKNDCLYIYHEKIIKFRLRYFIDKIEMSIISVNIYTYKKILKDFKKEFFDNEYLYIYQLIADFVFGKMGLKKELISKSNQFIINYLEDKLLLYIDKLNQMKNEINKYQFDYCSIHNFENLKRLKNEIVNYSNYTSNLEVLLVYIKYCSKLKLNENQ